MGQERRSNLAPAVGAKATTSRGDGVRLRSRSREDPGRSRRVMERIHVWRGAQRAACQQQSLSFHAALRSGRSSWPVDSIVRSGRIVQADSSNTPNSIYPSLSPERRGIKGRVLPRGNPSSRSKDEKLPDGLPEPFCPAHGWIDEKAGLTRCILQDNTVLPASGTRSV